MSTIDVVDSTNIMPPGTLRLSGKDSQGETQILRHPRPTDDSNDPLNWSMLRKSINFGLALFYVLFTFVLLNVSAVGYEQLVQDIGLDYKVYNAGVAANYAGLAIGCMAFIPPVHKYGRRPIYMASLLIQLCGAIWGANMKSTGEFIGVNIVLGLGGAISEALVQVTIADLFFVHTYATMNGLFLFAQATGSFLGPVAAGYVIQSMGWRWTWWWCVVFIGLSLVLVAIFFEDTSYTPMVLGDQPWRESTVDTHRLKDRSPCTKQDDDKDLERSPTISSVVMAQTVPTRSYRQRIALYQKNDVSIRHHFYQPFIILFRFPAAWYAAITFGSLISWYSVLLSVMSVRLPQAPYNFSASAVGLMFIAPFVGLLISTVSAGPISDWMIVRLAARNGGIYEPEMRLYPAIFYAFVAFAGVLTYGLGISQNAPWIQLAAGLSVYTSGFVGCADTSLAYLTDSYADIIGDAMVGVIFVRNAISVIVMFGLTPWLDGMGIQNTFILLAVVCLALSMIPVPLIVWGKRMRINTSKIYNHYSIRQPLRRT